MRNDMEYRICNQQSEFVDLVDFELAQCDHQQSAANGYLSEVMCLSPWYMLDVAWLQH